ncbi:hypothetical protein [Streptomyces smyrnaeus]|uniref:hypothetical protein n=1 Tax=Streptomyces smyrnaeus TaxID=1387713 RepID=UPI0033CAA353
MTKHSACSETSPSRLRVLFATPEPELNREAAAVLLRIFKQYAEHNGAPTSVELRLDDPANHQQKEHLSERN